MLGYRLMQQKLRIVHDIEISRSFISSFQFFASLYVNIPCLSNPMTALVEKRALKLLYDQGLHFCPRQRIPFNLFLPSENTGSLKFPGKLLMLPW